MAEKPYDLTLEFAQDAFCKQVVPLMAKYMGMNPDEISRVSVKIDFTLSLDEYRKWMKLRNCKTSL